MSRSSHSASGSWVMNTPLPLFFICVFVFVFTPLYDCLGTRFLKMLVGGLRVACWSWLRVLSFWQLVEIQVLFPREFATSWSSYILAKKSLKLLPEIIE